MKFQKDNRVSLNKFEWVKKDKTRLTLNTNFNNQLQHNKNSFKASRKSSNTLIGSSKSIYENLNPKTSMNGSKSDKIE